MTFRQKMRIIFIIAALLAFTSSQAQETTGRHATTDLQQVQPPTDMLADTPTPLHLPTLDNSGRVWTGRFPLFRPGWSTWNLHEGLNVNFGASAFASFGKHAHHGTGFGHNFSAMYAMPLTDKLSVAVGGYFNNLYWAHSAYRSAGLSAVMGYQFNEHWEAFLYGQKSLIHDRFTPYPLYDIGDLGDRIGAAVRYNVNPSFSVELSVEHGSLPHHDSLHDTYMKMPGVK